MDINTESCYMTLWRAKVLLMRHTATLQNRENVQAHTHCFATSGQRLLYVAQHLRTPAVFIPQMAYSSPQAHKNLYLKVQQALANTKPTAHSNQTFPSKQLFIPNKIHTFAADNCIKSGKICPPTGQLS